MAKFPTKSVEEFVDDLLDEKKMAPTRILIKSKTKGEYTDKKCTCKNTGWHEPGRCDNFLKPGTDRCGTCSQGHI